MRFHHIGIATKDIDETLISLKKYLDIKEVSNVIYDKNQGASLCMITLNDDSKFELVSGDIVENFLKKHQYLYHTCYTVSNIDETIISLIKDGAILVKEPKNAILFGNKKVAFLMWKIGLIELLEEDD